MVSSVDMIFGLFLFLFDYLYQAKIIELIYKDLDIFFQNHNYSIILFFLLLKAYFVSNNYKNLIKTRAKLQKV